MTMILPSRHIHYHHDQDHEGKRTRSQRETIQTKTSTDDHWQDNAQSQDVYDDVDVDVKPQSIEGYRSFP
jgi:hypothetical protein